MQRHLPIKRRQRAVALITAMLITALATLITTAMMARQQLDIRRTGNLLQLEQGYQYARGLEEWAMQILNRDWKSSKQSDHLGEPWATPLPPIPVEGGEIMGYIEDADARFNLNSLIDSKGQIDALNLGRFQRLLAAVSLSPDLANAVLDWIDSDDNVTSPGGAEDSDYLSLERPYRAGNGPMASSSELMMVNGFDAETYLKIAPFVIALPAPSSINVNTAPAEVLMSLANNISQANADSLVQKRTGTPFTDINTFITDPVFAGQKLDPKGLAVVSSHFLTHADAQIDRVRVQLNSLLYRDGSSGKLLVLMRAQGSY